MFNFNKTQKKVSIITTLEEEDMFMVFEKTSEISSID